MLARDPDDGNSVWESQVVDACDGAARQSISGERRVLTRARDSTVVAQPLLAEDGDMLGVLVVVTTRSPAPGMLGAVGEVARYAASHTAFLQDGRVLAMRPTAELFASGLPALKDYLGEW